MGSGSSGSRVLAALIVLGSGAFGAAWAGAQGMDGSAVLATFASVVAFFGMLAWPAVTSAILFASIVAVATATGAHVEALGLVLSAAGLGALLARRRISPPAEPPAPHLTLLKG
jgi:hypothetical protein